MARTMCSKPTPSWKPCGNESLYLLGTAATPRILRAEGPMSLWVRVGSGRSLLVLDGSSFRDRSTAPWPSEGSHLDYWINSRLPILPTATPQPGRRTPFPVDPVRHASPRSGEDVRPLDLRERLEQCQDDKEGDAQPDPDREDPSRWIGRELDQILENGIDPVRGGWGLPHVRAPRSILAPFVTAPDRLTVCPLCQG